MLPTYIGEYNIHKRILNISAISNLEMQVFTG